MIAAVIAAGCAICFYVPDNMVFDRVGQLYITDTDGKQQSRLVMLLLATWHRQRGAEAT
jgi:secreted PhoX family phosphatase